MPGGTAPVEGETKHATLLCGLVVLPLAGPRGETLEALQRRREQWLLEAFMQVARWEGTLIYGEDRGFLALFGAPMAHEAHAQQAVQAACALQTHWQGHRGAQREPDAVRSLQGQLGIHTTSVTDWRHGPPHLTHGPLLGEAHGLVTQLAQHAAPGTILVSDMTAHLVRDIVSLRARSPLALLERPSTLATYQVLPERSPTLLPRSAGHPVVGREHELALLKPSSRPSTRGAGRSLGLSATLAWVSRVFLLSSTVASPDTLSRGLKYAV